MVAKHGAKPQLSEDKKKKLARLAAFEKQARHLYQRTFMGVCHS